MFTQDKNVADWKDLQSKVAQLFHEIGLHFGGLNV